jgi:hypothetical protein
MGYKILLDILVRGKEGALVEGFRHTRGNPVRLVDADESVRPAECGMMYSRLDLRGGGIVSRARRRCGCTRGARASN